MKHAYNRATERRGSHSSVSSARLNTTANISSPSWPSSLASASDDPKASSTIAPGHSGDNVRRVKRTSEIVKSSSSGSVVHLNQKPTGIILATPSALPFREPLTSRVPQNTENPRPTRSHGPSTPYPVRQNQRFSDAGRTATSTSTGNRNARVMGDSVMMTSERHVTSTAGQVPIATEARPAMVVRPINMSGFGIPPTEHAASPIRQPGHAPWRRLSYLNQDTAQYPISWHCTSPPAYASHYLQSGQNRLADWERPYTSNLTSSRSMPGASSIASVASACPSDYYALDSDIGGDISLSSGQRNDYFDDLRHPARTVGSAMPGPQYTQCVLEQYLCDLIAGDYPIGQMPTSLEPSRSSDTGPSAVAPPSCSISTRQEHPAALDQLRSTDPLEPFRLLEYRIHDALHDLHTDDAHNHSTTSRSIGSRDRSTSSADPRRRSPATCIESNRTPTDIIDSMRESLPDSPAATSNPIFSSVTSNSMLEQFNKNELLYLLKAVQDLLVIRSQSVEHRPPGSQDPRDTQCSELLGGSSNTASSLQSCNPVRGSAETRGLLHGSTSVGRIDDLLDAAGSVGESVTPDLMHKRLPLGFQHFKRYLDDKFGPDHQALASEKRSIAESVRSAPIATSPISQPLRGISGPRRVRDLSSERSVPLLRDSPVNFGVDDGRGGIHYPPVSIRSAPIPRGAEEWSSRYNEASGCATPYMGHETLAGSGQLSPSSLDQLGPSASYCGAMNSDAAAAWELAGGPPVDTFQATSPVHPDDAGSQAWPPPPPPPLWNSPTLPPMSGGGAAANFVPCHHRSYCSTPEIPDSYNAPVFDFPRGNRYCGPGGLNSPAMATNVPQQVPQQPVWYRYSPYGESGGIPTAVQQSGSANFSPEHVPTGWRPSWHRPMYASPGPSMHSVDAMGRGGAQQQHNLDANNQIPMGHPDGGARVASPTVGSLSQSPSGAIIMGDPMHPASRRLDRTHSALYSPPPASSLQASRAAAGGVGGPGGLTRPPFHHHHHNYYYYYYYGMPSSPTFDSAVWNSANAWYSRAGHCQSPYLLRMPRSGSAGAGFYAPPESTGGPTTGSLIYPTPPTPPLQHQHQQLQPQLARERSVGPDMTGAMPSMPRAHPRCRYTTRYQQTTAGSNELLPSPPQQHAPHYDSPVGTVTHRSMSSSLSANDLAGYRTKHALEMTQSTRSSFDLAPELPSDPTLALLDGTDFYSKISACIELDNSLHLSVPAGWSERRSTFGRSYYACDQTRQASWHHPTIGLYLPIGWERVDSRNSGVYYQNLLIPHCQRHHPNLWLPGPLKDPSVEGESFFSDLRYLQSSMRHRLDGVNYTNLDVYKNTNSIVEERSFKQHFQQLAVEQMVEATRALDQLFYKELHNLVVHFEQERMLIASTMFTFQPNPETIFPAQEEVCH